MGRKTKTRKRIVPLSGLKNILENYYVLQRFSGHAYKYVPTKLISVQRHNTCRNHSFDLGMGGLGLVEELCQCVER